MSEAYVEIDILRKQAIINGAAAKIKAARQTANASETLTAAWWIIPAAILGALVWMMIGVGVMG